MCVLLGVRRNTVRRDVWPNMSVPPKEFLCEVRVSTSAGDNGTGVVSGMGVRG
jgi:hypothetical protein